MKKYTTSAVDDFTTTEKVLEQFKQGTLIRNEGIPDHEHLLTKNEALNSNTKEDEDEEKEEEENESEEEVCKHASHVYHSNQYFA